MKYVSLILLMMIAGYSHADSLMFTCKITGIDLNSFIIDTDSQKITFPSIFADALGPDNPSNSFKLVSLNEEYLHLERAYEGKRNRKSGMIKESVYILRYKSYIGKQTPAIRAKYETRINDELIIGGDGRCNFATKLF